MRHRYRSLVLALSLGLATAAGAQENPTGRGGIDRNPFGSGSLTAPGPQGADVGRTAFGQHGFGRPSTRRSVVPVTPVPEPGQWAMMLAGLALVGWIVRRNTRR